MKMVEDGVRRRVAAALRAEVGIGHSWPGTERLGVILGVEGGPGFPGRFLSRLADLIDPDCEEGRYGGVHTARPVDREALLVEAKEAEKSAWYFALDHDENELRDRLTEAAEDFSDMARRIREACGEVVE